MRLIGITGGIGAGKTEVLSLSDSIIFAKSVWLTRWHTLFSRRVRIVM